MEDAGGIFPEGLEVVEAVSENRNTSAVDMAVAAALVVISWVFTGQQIQTEAVCRVWTIAKIAEDPEKIMEQGQSSQVNKDE